MGLVIPFRRKHEHTLLSHELELLDRLRGSLQAMWRGGWAVPGDDSGIALMRGSHCLGVWSYERSEFVYRPIESGEPNIRAASVEAAYRHCLLILGELQPREQA
jgi:hypothetical protein